MRLCILFAIVFSCFFASPASTHADLIIGNLPQDNDNRGFVIGGVSDIRHGVGFTMPASQQVQLGSAVLRLDHDASGEDTPVVALYGDDGGGQPTGSPLVSFINPTIGTGIQSYTFLPTTPFTLQSNTTYWLVASGKQTSNSFHWAGSVPSITPTGLAAFFGTRVGTGGSLPNINETNIPSFQINAIPEPNSLLLLVAGCAVLMRRPK